VLDLVRKNNVYDIYKALIYRVYYAAYPLIVAKNGWHLDEDSLPRPLESQKGWEIIRFRFGDKYEYDKSINGICAIAGKDKRGNDYIHISPIYDEPWIVPLDVTDKEIVYILKKAMNATEEYCKKHKK